jgi:hypothetical protein
MSSNSWILIRHTPIITTFGRSRVKRRYFCFGAFSTIIPLGVTGFAALAEEYYQKYGIDTMVQSIFCEGLSFCLAKKHLMLFS